ncbi:MAG: hypothetical protein IJ246_12480 [Clostridia bacterium]|nr:hypothetical protein [Clostridia bacterium]
MLKRMLSCILCLCLVLGCTSLSDAAENDTLNILISAEPVTLNTLESKSNLDTYVFYLTSALLYRSIGLEVIPELCDTMTVSEDGTTYTYTIKDARYSDGTPIVADDFVYFMIKNYLTGDNAWMFVGGEDTINGSLDTCEGIYALDDKTFVVTLAAPNVTFNGKLEIYPVNRTFVEAKGAAYGGTPADLQYSGPYILDDWTIGTSLTLHKNPDYIYADTYFPVQNVGLYYSADISSRYSMWQNDEVDVMVNVPNELVELLGEENCNKYTAGNVVGIEFNTTGFTYSEGDGFQSRGEDVTALLKNRNFRMALCYAVDREALVDSISPSETAFNRYVDPNIPYGESTYVDSFPMENVIPLTGDADKARECLQKALEELGYASVSELPKLSYLCFETDVQKMFAVTMVSLWKSILGLENIEINMQPIQSAIMSMVFMNYDLYTQQLTLNPDNMLELLSYWETTGGVSDAAGFQASGVPSFMASIHANADYDALVESMYANFDEASRYADAAKAEQMLYDDFVFFPLYAGGGFEIVKPYVEGWVNPYLENGYGIVNTTVAAH